VVPLLFLIFRAWRTGTEPLLAAIAMAPDELPIVDHSVAI
jgi:hypothetical protein